MPRRGGWVRGGVGRGRCAETLTQRPKWVVFHIQLPFRSVFSHLAFTTCFHSVQSCCENTSWKTQPRSGQNPPTSLLKFVPVSYYKGGVCYSHGAISCCSTNFCRFW